MYLLSDLSIVGLEHGSSLLMGGHFRDWQACIEPSRDTRRQNL